MLVESSMYQNQHSMNGKEGSMLKDDLAQHVSVLDNEQDDYQ